MSADDKSQRYSIADKRIDRLHVEIGKRIKIARKTSGLSQEQLAAAADVDRSHIGFIEQGRRKPTIATLYKVIKPLKITFEELFKGL